MKILNVLFIVMLLVSGEGWAKDKLCTKNCLCRLTISIDITGSWVGVVDKKCSLREYPTEFSVTDGQECVKKGRSVAVKLKDYYPSEFKSIKGASLMTGYYVNAEFHEANDQTTTTTVEMNERAEDLNGLDVFESSSKDRLRSYPPSFKRCQMLLPKSYKNSMKYNCSIDPNKENEPWPFSVYTDSAGACTQVAKANSASFATWNGSDLDLRTVRKNQGPHGGNVR